MSVYRIRNAAASALVAAALAALALLLVPFAGQAQVREVVSKEVSVGGTDATLRLEFRDGDRLSVAFDDGRILVDGEAIGAYEPGGELEAEWRELLAQAVALDDGPLAEALVEWTAPAALAGNLADLAREIDRTIEQALADVGTEVDSDADDPSVSMSIGDERSLLRVLIGSVGRLGALERALEGVNVDDTELRVHVDEAVEVGSDEVVPGSLVSIGGDVRVAGRIDGNVVVVGGTLELLDESSVSGDVRLADARLLRNEGEVGGDVVDVLEAERDVEVELAERIRAEVESEMREMDHEGGFSLVAPFRSVVRAAGGVIETLLVVLFLGLIGAAVLAFGSENLDAIAETARRTPGRAATVGLAGSFLLLPAWVLGFVALCISIIGIPVAIAWLPLFPAAALLAAAVGYLAVARNAGEWLADSEVPWTDWIRKSNPLIAMFGGLLGLTSLFVAGNVVSAAPFLDFITGILFFAACVVTFVAVQIGFGAVLLTRGGRRREFWSRYDDPDAAWEAAMNVDVGGPAEGAEKSENTREEDDA